MSSNKTLRRKFIVESNLDMAVRTQETDGRHKNIVSFIKYHELGAQRAQEHNEKHVNTIYATFKTNFDEHLIPNSYVRSFGQMRMQQQHQMAEYM